MVFEQTSHIGPQREYTALSKMPELAHSSL